MRKLKFLLRRTTLAVVLSAGFLMAQSGAAQAATSSFCVWWGDDIYCVGVNSDGKGCIATSDDVWCTG